MTQIMFCGYWAVTDQTEHLVSVNLQITTSSSQLSYTVYKDMYEIKNL